MIRKTLPNLLVISLILGIATGQDSTSDEEEIKQTLIKMWAAIERKDLEEYAHYWTDEGVSQNTRFTSRGKSTRIFVRENGRWLCIHGHYTLVE